MPEEEPQGRQSPEAKDEVKGLEHSESTSDGNGSPQFGSEKEVEVGGPSTNGTGEGQHGKKVC